MAAMRSSDEPRTKIGRCGIGRIAVAFSLVLGVGHAQSQACGICKMPYESIRKRSEAAALVVHGSFSNPRTLADNGSDEAQRFTDMKLLETIKSHPILLGNSTFVVSGYVTAAKEKPVEYIFFADVKNGLIVPYDGIVVETPEVVEYAKGAVSTQKLSVTNRIAYFAKYIVHANEDISRDAVAECSQVSLQQLAAAKAHFDLHAAARCLRGKEPQPFRIGLLSVILGVCGRTQEAPLLRDLIVDPEKRPFTGLDEVMLGYCLLEPDAGPKLVFELLQDRRVEFAVRYAALRVATRIFGARDLPEAQRTKSFAKLLPIAAHEDIGDLVIDELRQAEQWQGAREILVLYADPKYKENELIRRAAIRYALRCPTFAARSFIEKVRKADPNRVTLEEENLRFDEEQAAQAAEAEKKAAAAKK